MRAAARRKVFCCGSRPSGGEPTQCAGAKYNRGDAAMAQYTRHFYGSLQDLLTYIDSTVMGGSISASSEGGFDIEMDGVCCVARVYERYSYLGGNRLSLSVTLFGRDGDITLNAITAGGSQSLFFKRNTWGEQAFLNKFIKQLDAYQPQ